MRREWIEIEIKRYQHDSTVGSPSMRREWIEMLSPTTHAASLPSPSMRREWIEILFLRHCFCPVGLSPSMRREWIEMRCWLCRCAAVFRSPSMRREWIEIFELFPDFCNFLCCLPPCGGSGLKWICHFLTPSTFSGLPPCGGSGLKCDLHRLNRQLRHASPSMRREWIEIPCGSLDAISIVVSLHAEGVD